LKLQHFFSFIFFSDLQTIFMALILIPVPIGENSFHTVPAYVLEKLLSLEVLIVEEIKTARRIIAGALRWLHPDSNSQLVQQIISRKQFYQLNEHIAPAKMDELSLLLRTTPEIGLLSEAGCPAIADPGANLVQIAHRLNIEVIALPGPSSILLAIMGSGLSANGFCFHGYLPAKTQQRRQTIRKLLQQPSKLAHFFIEAPYRNTALFNDLLTICKSDTLISVAIGLSTPEAAIHTRTAGEWQQSPPQLLDKLPVVFGCYVQ
jgi:16S rRNA (cytidine1402-2'-O)-methyltransferase